MKAQLATLVLAERGYMQFKLHVHDDLLAAWRAQGRDVKDELRNSLMRHLKRRFGRAPWFFFVMEDLTTDGRPTRPHAHGSIEICPASLPLTRRGRVPRRLQRIADEQGHLAAELLAGRELIVEAMKAGGGNPAGLAKISKAGVDQTRNVWHRRPYHAIFNSQWVDYAFKNARKMSTTLGESRLALPYGLLGETQRLWRLVIEGEPAVDQWV